MNSDELRSIYCAVAILGVLSLTRECRAAESEPPEPRVLKLTITPSAPERPALRHSLIIEPYERTPGNAAQLYYRAMLSYKAQPNLKKLEETLSQSNQKWSGSPCQGEVREEIRAWLKQIPEGMLNDIRDATRRERCDFEHRRTELSLSRDIGAGAHEMDLRRFARLLRYQARMEIAGAKFAEARESLRQLYQLGCDASSDPSIISVFNGKAAVGAANEEVEHWIGTEGSPNLYWSLSAMPHPFIDVRPALVREVRNPEKLLSLLRDAETARHSDEEWARVISEGVVEKAEVNSEEDRERIASFDALIKLHYPTSKEWLIDNGYDAEKLIGMPRGQVVAIRMYRVLREITDEFAKGIYLPKNQIDAYYDDLATRISKDLDPLGRLHEIIPAARLLMPAVHAALTGQTSLEMEFAGLRTLEAIRAQLAETGTFPDKLDDIKTVPLPVDPVTHQAFEYERSESGAILIIPGVRGVPAKRYELMVGKK